MTKTKKYTVDVKTLDGIKKENKIAAYVLSVKKLCSRHKTKDSIVVKSANCSICQLEDKINSVLELPQFRDLKI